ncbi:MAG: protein kinase [Polyangiaceae bacterium]
MTSRGKDLADRARGRLGRVLREKWTLDELLGLGGMAAVYSATHRNGNRVAIKILEPEAATVKDVRTRFLREGYLANQVEHTGAVSIQDDDVDEDGTPFLVMELLDGQSLDSRWQEERKLPWQDVLLIAHGILDVLAAAQEKGIVHRDLKPGNVFIERDGSVKVLDFGIARLAQGDFQPGNTGYDTALGTPGFISPEQARGRWDQVDGKSDLFSVGATMFALLTGRHVHEAETANEQFALSMTERAPALAEIEPELPPAVCAVVDRALQYDKQDRWQDARAMMLAVAEVYHELTGDELRPAPRKRSIPVRQARDVSLDAPTVAADTTHDRKTTTRPVSHGDVREPRSRMPILAVALLLLVGVLGFVFVRSQDQSPDAAASSRRDAASQAMASRATAPQAAPAELESAQPAVESAASASTAPEASIPAERAELPRAAKPRDPSPKPAVAPVKPPSSASSAVKTEVDIFTRRK